MGITLKECVRGGLLGAAAAAAFSGALATALVSSAPSVSPALAASHAATPAGRFVTMPAPTITVSPTSGGPGTVVTVVGKGFVPPPAAMGEAGDQFEYGNPPSSGGAPISSSGRFKATLKVTSTDRRGKNVIQVTEEYGCTSGIDSVCEAVASATFTVK